VGTGIFSPAGWFLYKNAFAGSGYTPQIPIAASYTPEGVFKAAERLFFNSASDFSAYASDRDALVSQFRQFVNTLPCTPPWYVKVVMTIKDVVAGALAPIPVAQGKAVGTSGGSTLDPSSQPVTISLAAPDGTAYQAAISPGAFKGNTAGTVFKFADKAGTIANGITRAVITKGQNDSFKLSFKAAGPQLGGLLHPTVSVGLRVGSQSYEASFPVKLPPTKILASLPTTTTTTTTTTSTTSTTEPVVCCAGSGSGPAGAGSLCWWATAGQCAPQGWDQGAPGTVCDGATGQCVVPPATAALCCDVGIVVPPCLAGEPNATQAICSGLQGILFSSATCTPSGCVPYTAGTTSTTITTASTTTTTLAPGAFTLLVATACPNEIPNAGLAWTSSSGATQYQVYRDGTSLVSFPSSTTAYIDSGVAFGQTHTWTVVAVNGAGATSSSSSTSLVDCCATVTGTGGIGLNVRSCPSLSCTQIDNMPEGWGTIIDGGPVSADGFIWYHVSTTPTFMPGWSAGDWLIPNGGTGICPG
jgi:hypothetical protein